MWVEGWLSLMSFLYTHRLPSLLHRKIILPTDRCWKSSNNLRTFFHSQVFLSLQQQCQFWKMMRERIALALQSTQIILVHFCYLKYKFHLVTKLNLIFGWGKTPSTKTHPFLCFCINRTSFPSQTQLVIRDAAMECGSISSDRCES